MAIYWPTDSDIEITVDSALDATVRPALAWAIDQVESIVPYTFREVPTDGAWGVAPLDDVLRAFGISGNYLGINVTNYGAGYAGVQSIVGLDPAGLAAAGYDLKVAVLHEMLHGLGEKDLPFSTGAQSVMGYGWPRPEGLTADAIDTLQSWHGTSWRADVITVTGITGGRAVRGGLGADTVSGSYDADDLVYGNQGADHLFGNDGADTLYGGQDADTISGGDGADLIYGNLGNDVLIGGAGADTLYGGQGNDVIRADDFDRIVGGAGADTVYGGGSWDDYDPAGGDRWFNPDGTARIELAGTAGADPFDPMTGA
jgi:Ca2+-binding RTX toxin-like protein